MKSTYDPIIRLVGHCIYYLLCVAHIMLLVSNMYFKPSEPQLVVLKERKERCTLAITPRALRKEPPIDSHQRGHLFDFTISATRIRTGVLLLAVALETKTKCRYLAYGINI